MKLKEFERPGGGGGGAPLAPLLSPPLQTVLSNMSLKVETLYSVVPKNSCHWLKSCSHRQWTGTVANEEFFKECTKQIQNVKNAIYVLQIIFSQAL